MVTDGIFLEYGNLTYVLLERTVNVGLIAFMLGFCISGGLEIVWDVTKYFFSKFKKDGVENG